jgi:hypothetical protein
MTLRPVVLALAAVAAITFVPASSAMPPGLSAQFLPPGIHASYERGGVISINVCPAPTKPGEATCFADLRIDSRARSETPASTAGPAAPQTVGDGGAYSPAFLQSAYNAPSATGGAGKTVAIVSAFDDPSAESDLAVYRSQYGLPPCTTANGCFSKVNAFGNASPLPPTEPDVGEWPFETSLDIDMVSALCPNCHILLVEATGPDTITGGGDLSGGLNTAVGSAVALGANVVSMSWGNYAEQDVRFEATFEHPGVRFFAASGDSGYGATNYPAASNYVTAVGGTTLNQATSTGTRNATETAWGGLVDLPVPHFEGSGSGCDLFNPKPSWQPNVCSGMRAVADVSADGDPATPVWVYDSQPLDGSPPDWGEAGGTSASAPIVAGIAALASAPSGSIDNPSSIPYSHPGAFNDITSGMSAQCQASICQAKAGFDAPTGLGTPNGSAGFAPAAPGTVGNLAAAAESAKVTLSWSAPALIGGSNIKGYRVFRSDRGTAPIASLGASASAFTDIGLANGTTYTYKVAAVNALGQGPTSLVSATPAPVAKLVLSPKTATIRAGGSQQYSLQAFNASGKALGDESARATFTETLGPKCPKGLCSPTKSGAHIVTAALDSVKTTAKLIVRGGPLANLVVSPRTATILAGRSRVFTAAAADRFGNPLGNVTADVVFQISPNGSCTSNICTAATSGKHKIRAILRSTAVAMGYEGNCALTVMGSVECWGTNYIGNIADTVGLGQRTPPATVPGLEQGVTAVSLDSGIGCAIQGGAAECFTGNADELGSASAVGSLNPTQVAGLTSGVKSIGASDYSSCAVTGAGGVDCWGNGTWRATPIAGLSGTASSVVSSFDGLSCALMTSAGVECWGFDDLGQLGDNYANSPGPGGPVGVIGLQSGVRQVAVGSEHACALTTAGQVKCWGDNADGELGNGTMNNSGVPVAVSGLPGPVQSIGANGFDTCAVTTAGAVYCWGVDGNGVQTEADTPLLVPGLGSGMKSVAVGGGTDCALSSAGIVECWGANQFGQLGAVPGASFAVTVPMGSYYEAPAILTVS